MESTDNKNLKWSKHAFQVAPDVWGLKTVFVNLYFISTIDNSWVLVDTGVYGSAGKIKQAAADLFGEGNRPKAILLTHGHFDHVGAVKELATEWDVPVYAHPLELPYLTGRSSYPPPDPSVGGGGMAYMSFLYPKAPIDITTQIELLPEDGSVPALPEWHWIHTPGHTAGHVSFFRERDRLLIAGDAFVTRHGESMMAVITQKAEVHGPPAYYTSNWVEAHHSVEKLASLDPKTAATGHGVPMRAQQLKWQLEDLVQNFWLKAVPEKGRYVNEPAVTDEQGVISVPPSNTMSTGTTVWAAAGLAVVAGATVMALRNRNAKKQRQKTEKFAGRPYSHNRPLESFPPTVDPEHDDPHEHTNYYP